MWSYKFSPHGDSASISAGIDCFFLNEKLFHNLFYCSLGGQISYFLHIIQTLHQRQNINFLVIFQSYLSLSYMNTSQIEELILETFQQKEENDFISSA